jgi:16S rRNA (cytidine1402-2'-O)-methyltransferase
MTPRAARILAEVSLVAAEDTRRTRQLLTHLGISKPMVSLHADAERARTDQVLRALESGDVAFCTDGGMPNISDPGAFLVDHAHAAGVRVEVIPGPSAVTSALALAGVPANRFVFAGFLPRKSSEMTRTVAELGALSMPTVYFESPVRLLKALDIISTTLPDRRCWVAREMTKVHEELRSGSAAELALHYRAHPPRGEVTLIVGGAQRSRT